MLKLVKGVKAVGIRTDFGLWFEVLRDDHVRSVAPFYFTAKEFKPIIRRLKQLEKKLIDERTFLLLVREGLIQRSGD
jgi:hypothetical protein